MGLQIPKPLDDDGGVDASGRHITLHEHAYSANVLAGLARNMVPGLPHYTCRYWATGQDLTCAAVSTGVGNVAAIDEEVVHRLNAIERLDAAGAGASTVDAKGLVGGGG